MTPTKKQLLEHYECVGEPTELTEYAAAAAAGELATNWAAALGDGKPIEDLLEDVDTVCALLQAWKMQLAR